MMFRDRIGYYCFGLLLILVIGLYPVKAQSNISQREYKIKTAYMLKFFKLTEWSKEKESGDFLFCTSNKDFTRLAESILNTKSVRGRAIHLTHITPDNDQHCDALFITKYEQSEWRDILLKRRQNHRLIIGEQSGFAKELGHVRLFRANNRLRFQVNVDALKESQLRMSPQLLRLALIVSSKSKKGANQ